ncbi:MAG: AMP-dependent synthetase/ligase [Myxococcales bacterium]
MRASTIHAFFETAARQPERPAVRFRSSPGTWTSIRWSKYATEVRRVARGLLSLGVKAGDRVAICGSNRFEWLLADLGALAAGAVPAPYYPTLPPDQAAYVIDQSEARVAIVEDAGQLAKIEKSRKLLPRLRQCVLMEGSAKGAISFADLQRCAGAVTDREIDERLAALTPETLATLIYTSGTTGRQKAVMISHGNLLFSAELAASILQTRPGDVVVSYLPLSHVAEQMISLHAAATSGYEVACCQHLEELPATLREVRPTSFLGVPRVWEKIQAKIEAGVAAANPRRRALFGWARRVGLEAARGQRTLLLPVARKLVHDRVRAALGLDRARLLATSAAPINRSTLEFFESLGMPLYEVYGQSECTGGTTSNLSGRRRVFSVGVALPGTEVKVAPDGEILLKGPHVFGGYYKDPAATAEAFTPDGFLRTGDVGELDRDGFLRITDRKKDLIITSGGKNVSPQNIEKLLAGIPGVAQAVVVGDARKHLAALFTLDPEAALREAKACGSSCGTVEEIARDPRFVARIAEGVNAVNGELASFETIKRFHILPVEFTVESGELTPTMKVKRKIVGQRFAREIEDLFRDGAAA